jgi:hypothetical protein
MTIGQRKPEQLLAREVMKDWATSPVEAPVGVPAKTADLFARNRTVLRQLPQSQQNHAWQ